MIDAFLAHSSHTISNHVQEVRFLTKYGEALGFDALPPLGLFPIGDHKGMLQGLVLKMRLLEKGRHDRTVLFGIIKMIKSTITVLWENSPLSKSDIVLSSENMRGWYIATLCPSESRWYKNFSRGVATRSGDIAK